MSRVPVRSLARGRWLLVLACLSLLLLPTLGLAQATGLTAADRADVRAFTFNTNVFARLQEVVGQARTLELKRGRVDMAKVHSLDDLAAQLVASDPRIQSLLAKYDFTPRQFLVANLALVATVVPLQRAQTAAEKQAVKAQMNPANVRFYEAHKQAMQQLVYAANAR